MCVLIHKKQMMVISEVNKVTGLKINISPVGRLGRLSSRDDDNSCPNRNPSQFISFTNICALNSHVDPQVVSYFQQQRIGVKG